MSTGTALGAFAALLFVREPRLNLAGPRAVVGGRPRAMASVIAHTPDVLRAVVGIAVCTALLQALLEFGQFWLLAADGERGWFGLGFAGLLLAAGAGSVIASRLPWARPALRITIGVIAVASALLLSQPLPIAAVIVLQCVLAACAAAVSVYLTRSMHDRIPAGVRTSVASVAAFGGWLTFLPLAVLSGWFYGFGGIAFLSVPVVALAVATVAIVTPFSSPARTAPREFGSSSEK